MPVDTLPPFADHTGSIDPAPAGGDLAWLTRLRAQGLERYRSLGLPTPRVEDWKYTNLKALAGIDFAPAAEAPDPAAPTALPDGLKVDAIRRVVVNGRFRPDLSAPDGLPDGVEAGGLAQMLARDPAAIEAHLGQIAVIDGMPLLALNTALMTDGFVLRLAAGVELDRPIHVLFVGAAGDRALSCHPRNLIVAHPGSRATVFESHVGAGTTPTFGNVVTEVSVGEGAVLNHYKLHDEPAAAFHLATTRVALDNESVYDSFVLSVGGRLSRHELRVCLGGGVIDCRLNGAYVIAGDQHVDNTIFVDHAAPGSRSRQHYKGVLDDTARGVFRARSWSVGRPSRPTAISSTGRCCCRLGPRWIASPNSRSTPTT